MAFRVQYAADVQAAASASLAAATWLADVAWWLQIVATLVAIVAGISASWWHIERASRARRERLGR